MPDSFWYANIRGKTATERIERIRIDLSVHGVCRQLYEEANHMLWTTSTFAFADGHSLGKFLGGLNIVHRRKFRSLELSVVQRGYSFEEDFKFGLAKPSKVPKKLSHIRSMSLHYTWKPPEDTWRLSQDHLKEKGSWLIRLGLRKAFEGLSVLGLQQLQVSICEEPANNYVFTNTERELLAADFRNELLADSGSE